MAGGDDVVLARLFALELTTNAAAVEAGRATPVIRARLRELVAALKQAPSSRDAARDYVDQVAVDAVATLRPMFWDMRQAHRTGTSARRLVDAFVDVLPQLQLGRRLDDAAAADVRAIVVQFLRRRPGMTPMQAAVAAAYRLLQLRGVRRQQLRQTAVQRGVRATRVRVPAARRGRPAVVEMDRGDRAVELLRARLLERR